MKQILIVNIHSMIDVITNSSTEIFTFAKNNAVELCHEAINEILKVSGSDKKSEELFDIEIETEKNSGYDTDPTNVVIKAKNSNVSTKEIYSIFKNASYEKEVYC